MLQVPGIARQTGLFVLLILELFGAAWVLRAVHVSFPPLPTILAAAVAALLALGLHMTRASRQRQTTAQALTGRLTQAGIDRLTESEPLNLFEASVQEASFVYCEIANEADLIDDLPPAACAQLAAGIHRLREEVLSCEMGATCRRPMAKVSAFFSDFPTEARSTPSKRLVPRLLSGRNFRLPPPGRIR